jgi:hypothetical protein
MNLKSILTASLCALLLAGCYWPGSVDQVWSEEVQMPDGRTFVVKRVTTYVCHDYRFRQFGGTCSGNDTTLTLNGGEGIGVVTQLFKGFRPMFLGEKDGIWYAILIGGYRYKNREIPGQDWGDQEGPYGQWAIRLVAGKWQPMPLADFPVEFQKPNMLLLYGTAEELAKFHQRRVTLQDKADWVAQNPPGPSHVNITRPKPSAPR